MHLLDGYEEATGEPSDTGDDGGQSERPHGEGADESNEESYPALVEDQVHHHQLAIDRAIVGRRVHQLMTHMYIHTLEHLHYSSLFFNFASLVK